MIRHRKLAAVLSVLFTTLCLHASDLAVLRNGFSIRHERREQTGATTRLHLSGGGFVEISTAEIERFEKDDFIPQKPSASAQKSSPEVLDVNRAVSTASSKHMVDEDLIASIIRAESGFNPRAVSPKGAQGLMQLMPGTASRLGVNDAFDPGTNVDGGTRYLRDLLVRYDNNMAKALAAYNAGPRRVERYKGIPPYHETRIYVAKVIAEFNRKKLAAKAAERLHTQGKKTSHSASRLGQQQAAGF